ncbi:MAG: 50S ribosomal protein L18e [Candidatus Nanoarchaeia archaeon]|nr:50S ribosomal protein L18e [Candidatus Nanoarchaeia archaeon]
MVKRTGPTDVNLRKLVSELNKTKTKFWKRIAEDLMKPRRQRRQVNISHINRFTEKGETVVVPGKVLSSGSLKHAINVAAWQFSASAEKKIKDADGKALKIETLVKENPKAKKLRIIG